MSEQTLVIIKPDAIQRGLIGEIFTRYEKKGLKVIGTKMMQLKDAILKEHYAHVIDQPFYDELSEFMSSSPVLVLCLEGVKAIETVRKISGTDSFQFGTIRGDFSTSNQRNLVHSSDSSDMAHSEIQRFFETEDLFIYDKEEWRHIYADSDKTNT